MGWNRMYTVQVTKDEIVEALMEWKSELFPTLNSTVSNATVEQEDQGIFTIRFYDEVT